MTQFRILIVEDEAAIREMLVFALQASGMDVIEASNAEQGWQLATTSAPDLVLLDWMLPGVPGVSLLTRLKSHEKLKSVPVIMLTARADEADQVQGFESGADDYVTKPFSPRTLIARIRALLRRYDDTASEIISAGRMQLDAISHRVTIDGIEVKVGPKEFSLLYFFMRHIDRVFTRNQLLDEVWGDRVVVEDRTIDVHIRRLRRALEEYQCESYIQTIRGSGYRFSVIE